MKTEEPRPLSPQPPRTFWQRRITDPIVQLLTQGVTPDKMALTLALGTGLSMFPFLGFTSLLNLGVGLWLRLNQPILQTLNQLLGPVHLVMILVYVRIGETIWSAERMPFSVPALVDSLEHESFGVFLQRFGWAGIHAFTAWIITLPLIIFPLLFILRPLLRNVAQQLKSRRPQRLS
ncbi:MAG TPA: DUF2062 domain-containing protein [Opitutaceae bacterium]|nr:DUF2062 domain-containing protein [Opitutaceae bacterium]